MDGDGLTAARDALRAQDWQAAFDAASAAATTGDVQEAERLDLLADAAWWLGRLDDCIEAREEAHRLFDEAEDHRRAGGCAVWLWEHHLMKTHRAAGGAWLRRARRSLDGLPECTEQVALLLRETETTHAEGDLAGAERMATETMAMARRLRSPDHEAEALQTLGRILIDAGDLAEGMGHLDEAMLLAVQGRLGPYSTGKVYCSLIGACEEVGDLDRAAEWTEATQRWAERHPFAIFPGICRVHRAIILKSRGSLAEAEQEAARACEELAVSHVGNSAAAYIEVGDIRRRLGDLDRAEEAFERARELCGGQCGGLALLRLAQGRVEAAQSVITSCLSGTGNQLGRASLLPVAVHVAIAAGDLDGATAALTELDAIADQFASPLVRASSLSARGRLELAHGDVASARATLQQALEHWTSLDVPYEVATVRTLLGQVLQEMGDPAGAAESFAAAAALFERIGARLDAQLVLGDHKPVLPGGLTGREVEVLRLIAAGKSNNEVAQDLFLSVKTVSRHLSNIFTKIGVTSRAAATAWAFEQELVEARR